MLNFDPDRSIKQIVIVWGTGCRWTGLAQWWQGLNSSLEIKTYPGGSLSGYFLRVEAVWQFERQPLIPPFGLSLVYWSQPDEIFFFFFHKQKTASRIEVQNYYVNTDNSLFMHCIFQTLVTSKIFDFATTKTHLRWSTGPATCSSLETAKSKHSLFLGASNG